MEEAGQAQKSLQMEVEDPQGSQLAIETLQSSNAEGDRVGFSTSEEIGGGSESSETQETESQGSSRIHCGFLQMAESTSARTVHEEQGHETRVDHR